jgi:hypothetical protein
MKKKNIREKCENVTGSGYGAQAFSLYTMHK